MRTAAYLYACIISIPGHLAGPTVATPACRSSLARCEQLTGEAAGVLDQYMQRIDDLDRIIQPVAARTQVIFRTGQCAEIN